MTALRKLVVASALAGGALAVVAACSGGHSSSGGEPAPADAGADGVPELPDGGELDANVPSVVSCDAGATASGCGFLTVTLQGGLSASDCCYSCASGSDGFDWGIDHNNAIFDIEFAGGQPPIEQVGTFALGYVLIEQTAPDGSTVKWQTPPGACSVTITRSVCVPVAPGGPEDWLTGTGTCNMPAAPLSGNTGAPVTIGDFSFRNYVLIPDAAAGG